MRRRTAITAAPRPIPYNPDSPTPNDLEAPAMSDESKDTYGFEANEPPPPPESAPPPSPPHTPPGAPRMGRPIDDAPVVAPSSKSDPLPLEDDTPLSMRPIHDLDVCPNCGAPMTSTGEVLCMRCGFDLKTMRKVETRMGVVEVSHEGSMPEDTPYEQRKPLVAPGLGGTMVPLIVAGACGVILLIAYMAGAPGVFLPALEKAPTFGDKALGFLRMAVTTGMLTACGLGALWFLAFLHSMRVGDLALAAARMLAIVSVMQLVTLVNFAGNGVEWTIESILQAGIFAGLSIPLLGIKPRDAPTLLGSTVILYILLQLGAWLVSSVAR